MIDEMHKKRLQAEIEKIDREIRELQKQRTELFEFLSFPESYKKT